jgi:hypothetical protein
MTSRDKRKRKRQKENDNNNFDGLGDLTAKLVGLRGAQRAKAKGNGNFYC